MDEMLLKLINASKEDEDIVKNYLENNTIDDLFESYKELGLAEDTMEQIESLIIIIKNYENI